jgi:23S rRNA (guanosine2251-2'-O)-methyltransferase
VKRRGGGGTRIEGARPVIEAIRAGRRAVYEVSLPEAEATPGLRELRALCEERRIPVARARGGAVARAEPFPEEPFEALLEQTGERRIVALDGVTDVGNLGSIARSAEAAGATGIALEQRRAPPIDAGALRASAGAIEHLRVGRTPSLPRSLELAGAEGIARLGAAPGGVSIGDLDPRLLRGEWIWVFGAEDRGIRPAVLARLDHRIGIPTRGKLSSLGVAASAAYLLLRTLEIAAGAQAGNSVSS